MSCHLMDRKRLVIAENSEASNKRRKTAETEEIFVNVPCTAAIVSHVPSARVSESGTLSSAESSLSSVERPSFEPFSKIEDEEGVGQDSSELHHGPSCRGALDSLVNPCPESSESHAEQTDNSARCDESSAEFPLPPANPCPTAEGNHVWKATSSSVRVGGNGEKKAFSKANLESRPTLLQLAPLPKKTVLLSLPTDASVLNPLHVFVRKQIEVFQASLADIAQPAPGRKNAVSLGQVGLRCIHCRDLPPRDRVKRAVCYPSSVGRVYHSVSDMKFDHFSNCKGLPEHLKVVFNELKDDCKKKKTNERRKRSAGTCSSSTAQYYHDTAMSMGMVDKSTGVFMQTKTDLTGSESSHDAASKQVHAVEKSSASLKLDRDVSESKQGSAMGCSLPDSADEGSITVPRSLLPALILGQQQLQQNPYSLLPFAPMLYSMLLPAMNAPQKSPSDLPGNDDSAKCIPMASLEDYKHLNPLHCFVRRHVEIFTATKKDIAAPAPGRKARIVLGQVGIRCIHCAKQPLKDRVKRAVCYPPSINGIYHSVSNMKFDHFGKCTCLPKQAQAEFAALRAACSGRNPKGKDGKTSSASSSSTAQYYHASAVSVGLIDTPDGIRFKGSVSPAPAVSASKLPATTPANTALTSRKDANVTRTPPHEQRAQQQQQQQRESTQSQATDGISALMIAATEPGVRAAYDKQKSQLTAAMSC